MKELKALMMKAEEGFQSFEREAQMAGESREDMREKLQVGWAGAGAGGAGEGQAGGTQAGDSWCSESVPGAGILCAGRTVLGASTGGNKLAA